MGVFDTLSSAISSAAVDVGHAISDVGDVTASTFINPGNVIADAFGAVRDIADGDNVFSVLKGFAGNELEEAFYDLGDMFKSLGSSALNSGLSFVDFGLAINRDL
jgi:hypothetical protein